MAYYFQFLVFAIFLFGFSSQTHIDPDEVRAEKIDVRPLGKTITEEKDLVKSDGFMVSNCIHTCTCVIYDYVYITAW